MLVSRIGQLQLIPVENRLDCRSGRFRLQVVTDTFQKAMRCELDTTPKPLSSSEMQALFPYVQISLIEPGSSEQNRHAINGSQLLALQERPTPPLYGSKQCAT